MGSGNTKFELSEFQKKKLLTEFHLFYDVNGDGQISKEDFDLAKERICEMSGWKPGMKKYDRIGLLFREMWQQFQEHADLDSDGVVTEEEWLCTWTEIERRTYERKHREEIGKPSREDELPEIVLPDWAENYIKYKFDLYNRTGDGEIDIDEYEYVLSGFNISPPNCREAFKIFSVNNKISVTPGYFRALCIEYYRSQEAWSLGNYINGWQDFDAELAADERKQHEARK